MTVYPWQQLQWQQVVAQHQQKRLPHALLLSGRRGLGKKDFALSLANIVLCDTQSGEACGICRSCQLFRVGNHPDFFGIYPEEDNKTIKIDQIRELTVHLNQTSQRGGYQVAIINPAEMLNVAAANALLKTLEEPPGPVLLLLISSQRGRLPMTMTSRCQTIVFFAAANSQVLDWLVPQIADGQSAAQKLLKMADGAPLLALALANGNYLSLRDRLLQHLLTIYQDGINSIKNVNEFLKEDFYLVLQILFSLTKDVLQLQLNISPAYLIHDDQLASLRMLSQKISRQTLLNLMTQLPLAWQLLQSTISVNLQLLLEGLFLNYVS